MLCIIIISTFKTKCDFKLTKRSANYTFDYLKGAAYFYDFINALFIILLFSVVFIYLFKLFLLLYIVR